MLRNLALTCALALAAVSPLEAQLIGDPLSGRNTFPFGATVGGSGTRYQQVYASSNFAGPLAISSISFVEGRAGGTLTSALFEFYLSTTSRAVDGLSTDFDSNLGADTQLFGSFLLAGAAPSRLTFSGTGFAYDPSAGNLLLDIRLSDITSRGNASYGARNRDADGLFSRMHDFGAGFEGIGLLTEFEGSRVVVTPEPSPLAPLALGLAGLGLFARFRRGEELLSDT